MLTVIAENICGVRPLVPGWKKFEVCPQPVIPECDILIPSVAGKIRSSFKDTADSFILNISIPKGTEAVVKLPGDYSEILVNNKAYEGDWTFRSGEYKFICTK